MSRELITKEAGLPGDLCRLARFGANIADAHSCFIFVPQKILPRPAGAESADGSTRPADDGLVLGGFHSFSPDVFRECFLPRGSGLIGWVAKHNRSIHVSPFERDSRTLGVYAADQQLKSFIGIPVPLEGGSAEEPLAGVVACDSKKAFAFSKVQGKLLEDLAREIAREVALLSLAQERGSYEVSWEAFLERAKQLAAALGTNAIDVVRLRQTNFSQMESALGLGAAIQVLEQTARLIQQSLPPHFPVLRLPSGEIVLVVDNMMSSFYEGKIRAICGHVGVGQRTKVSPEFEFVRTAPRRKRGEATSIEQLIAETNAAAARPAEAAAGESYGYRRA